LWSLVVGVEEEDFLEVKLVEVVAEQVDLELELDYLYLEVYLLLLVLAASALQFPFFPQVVMELHQYFPQ